MTGRELIQFIQSNGYEDFEIFKDTSGSSIYDWNDLYRLEENDFVIDSMRQFIIIDTP